MAPRLSALCLGAACCLPALAPVASFLAPTLPARLPRSARASPAHASAASGGGWADAGAGAALAAGAVAGLALAGVGRAAARRRARGDVSQQAAKLTYFSLWAKGPSIALALEHSGMDWEGAFPEDWKTLKPTTPFLELPLLEVPGLGAIGHELAILNYVGRSSPKMGGADDKEFVVSQQLMNQAEDIYQKLAKLKTGLISGEEADAFWTDGNEATHNRNFGVRVFLKLLEGFHAKCGVEGGKFTSSGVTVGECKLFATLHTLKMIKADILADFLGLSGFYERFAAEAPTQAVLQGTGRMPGKFDQYFKF